MRVKKIFRRSSREMVTKIHLKRGEIMKFILIFVRDVEARFVSARSVNVICERMKRKRRTSQESKSHAH